MKYGGASAGSGDMARRGEVVSFGGSRRLEFLGADLFSGFRSVLVRLVVLALDRS